MSQPIYLAKNFRFIVAQVERGGVVVDDVAAVTVLDGVARVAEQLLPGTYLGFAKLKQNMKL